MFKKEYYFGYAEFLMKLYSGQFFFLIILVISFLLIQFQVVITKYMRERKHWHASRVYRWCDS